MRSSLWSTPKHIRRHKTRIGRHQTREYLRKKSPHILRIKKKKKIMVGNERKAWHSYCPQKNKKRKKRQNLVPQCKHSLTHSQTLLLAKQMAALRFPPQLQLRPSGGQHPQRVSVVLGSVRCGIAEASGEPAPMGQKTKYKDGVFEKLFMTLFAKKMDKFSSSNTSSNKGWLEYDYNSFVDASRRVMKGRSRLQQQQVVREVLLSMLPPGAPAQFRKLFPPTKWAAEFNAALTVPFFQWLVGPSQVIEVEVNGEKQYSGVLIKKCRYLENSGCVGMCVNMCKIPTQDFFTNEFGLPLTMNPKFDDMSCEMIYGQVPPPFEEDPVSKQPCFAELCSMANPNSSICYKIAG